MREFSYEIEEHIATLSKHGIISKELTLTSYQGGTPKFDLRSWSNFGEPDAKMLKGITMDKEELKELITALNKLKVD